MWMHSSAFGYCHIVIVLWSGGATLHLSGQDDALSSPSHVPCDRGSRNPSQEDPASQPCLTCARAPWHTGLVLFLATTAEALQPTCSGTSAGDWCFDGSCCPVLSAGSGDDKFLLLQASCSGSSPCSKPDYLSLDLPPSVQSVPPGNMRLTHSDSTGWQGRFSCQMSPSPPPIWNWPFDDSPPAAPPLILSSAPASGGFCANTEYTVELSDGSLCCDGSATTCGDNYVRFNWTDSINVCLQTASACTLPVSDRPPAAPDGMLLQCLHYSR